MATIGSLISVWIHRLFKLQQLFGMHCFKFLGDLDSTDLANWFILSPIPSFSPAIKYKEAEGNSCLICFIVVFYPRPVGTCWLMGFWRSSSMNSSCSCFFSERNGMMYDLRFSNTLSLKLKIKLEHIDFWLHKTHKLVVFTYVQVA